MITTKSSGRTLLLRFGVGLLVSSSAAFGLDERASPLTLAEKEAFLLNARVVKQWHVPRGVRNTSAAILNDGKMEHEAHIQTVDISLPSYQTARGVERDFRDSHKYNVAAYELAKLLDLDMVPPSVERKVDRQMAAVTWWVDNKMYDEVDRVRLKAQPPDIQGWDRQMYVVQVFDQLVGNTDRNRGNLVITKDWRIWMIDHTRAFRTHKNLDDPHNMVQCGRKLLTGMRKLDKATLKQHLGKYVESAQVDSILARRDKIVKFFDDEIASKGEQAVLYDLP